MLKVIYNSFTTTMIEIGQVVNTHGLKGDVKIKSDSDFKASRFAVGSVIYIEEVPYTISKFQPHKGFDLLHFKGIDTIEAALALKNVMLYAPLEEADLNENEYHVSQLIGLTVLEGSEVIGVVKEILHYPAQSILVVGDHRIPFVDAFIKEVSLNDKTIHVELIEGL